MSNVGHQITEKFMITKFISSYFSEISLKFEFFLKFQKKKKKFREKILVAFSSIEDLQMIIKF